MQTSWKMWPHGSMAFFAADEEVAVQMEEQRMSEDVERRIFEGREGDERMSLDAIACASCICVGLVELACA
jgi:hypothetical protein